MFRLNDINYSTVQGYVLLRLYQASLMVAAGVKPAEPYAVMSFITMVNDIIDSPLHNPDGSGSMLMIRIPNREMSKHFHDVLTKTRNRYYNYEDEYFTFFTFSFNVVKFLCTRGLTCLLLSLVHSATLAG